MRRNPPKIGRSGHLRCPSGGQAPRKPANNACLLFEKTPPPQSSQIAAPVQSPPCGRTLHSGWAVIPCWRRREMIRMVDRVLGQLSLADGLVQSEERSSTGSGG
jgi:hypothetical protein